MHTGQKVTRKKDKFDNEKFIKKNRNKSRHHSHAMKMKITTNFITVLLTKTHI